MALTRGSGSRLAVQTITLGGEAVDIPAYMSVDASGNAQAALFTASDLTAARISFNAIADQAIVAATAAQTTRVHRMRLTVAGATTITVKDGATTLEVIQFPAAGALVLDFTNRPYWTTSTNSAFILTASAAVQVEGRIEYVKS